MTDNELLLAISNIMDKKLEPINDRTKSIELTLENEVLPRLQNIGSYYLSTYKRYANGANQIEAIQTDIDIIKKVVTEHSEKLNDIA